MLRLDPERTNELNFRELMRRQSAVAPAPVCEETAGATRVLAPSTAAASVVASETLEASDGVAFRTEAAQPSQTEANKPVSALEATGSLRLPTRQGDLETNVREQPPGSPASIPQTIEPVRPTVPTGRQRQGRKRRRRRLNAAVRGNYESDDSVYDYDSDFIDDSEITEDFAADMQPGFGVLSSILGQRWNRIPSADPRPASAASTPERHQLASGMTGRSGPSQDDDFEEWAWSRRHSRVVLPQRVEEVARLLEARIRDLYGDKKPNGWEKVPELVELLAEFCESAVAARLASVPTSEGSVPYRFQEELFNRLAFLRTTKPKLLQVASARYWRQVERDAEEQLRQIRDQLHIAAEQLPAADGATESNLLERPALLDCVHQYFVHQVQALNAANFRYKKPRSVSKMLKVFAAELKQHPVFVNDASVTAKDLESVYRKRESELLAKRRAEREAERQRKREERQRDKEQQVTSQVDSEGRATPTHAGSQQNELEQQSPEASQTGSDSFTQPRAHPRQSTEQPEGDHLSDEGVSTAPADTPQAERNKRTHSLEERFAELRQWRYETDEWTPLHPYPSVICRRDRFRSVRLWVKSQRMIARGTGRGKLAPKDFYRRCKAELGVDLFHGLEIIGSVHTSPGEKPLYRPRPTGNPLISALKMPLPTGAPSTLFASMDRYRIPEDLAEEAAREAAAAAAAAAAPAWRSQTATPISDRGTPDVAASQRSTAEPPHASDNASSAIEAASSD